MILTQPSEHPSTSSLLMLDLPAFEVSSAARTSPTFALTSPSTIDQVSPRKGRSCSTTRLLEHMCRGFDAGIQISAVISLRSLILLTGRCSFAFLDKQRLQAIQTPTTFIVVNTHLQSQMGQTLPSVTQSFHSLWRLRLYRSYKGRSAEICRCPPEDGARYLASLTGSTMPLTTLYCAIS